MPYIAYKMSHEAAGQAHPSSNAEAQVADAIPTSDSKLSGEGTDDDGEGEKPVREKLKKTSIDTMSRSKHAESVTSPVDPRSAADLAESSAPINPTRGRPTRKRSFDDVQAEDATGDDDGSSEQPLSNHKRMRSREITNGEVLGGSSGDQDAATKEVKEILNAEPQTTSDDPLSRPATPPPTANERINSTVFSPLKKRHHDEVDRDERKSENSDDSYVHVGAEDALADNGPVDSKTEGKGEPEKKRTRDIATGELPAATETKKFDFGNTSSISPFGAAPVKESQAAEPEAKERATSPSAFASSGISAFASSASSPFGTLGTSSSKSSGFGGGAATANGKSGFGFGGSSSTPSPFTASSAGVFSGLPSSNSGGSFASATGFGGVRPLGGGLSSFASPANSGGIIGASAGPVKAFGAPAAEDEEEDEEEGSADSDPEGAEEKPKEKRFTEQEVETGEENEDTLFSCKAKLFNYSDKEWKERGVGTFKLNVNEAFDFGGEHEKKARFIMRTDGVHRVVLNTPVFKGMKVGSNSGTEPTGKMITMSAIENGKFLPLLLKTGSLELARDLYRKIKEVQESLPA